MAKSGDIVLVECRVVRQDAMRQFTLVEIKGIPHPVPVSDSAIVSAEEARYRNREVDFAVGRAPFSANLRRIRQGRNMTQRELADKVGVAQGAVWQWEDGRTRPRVETLEKVCMALGVSPDQLFAKENQ